MSWIELHDSARDHPKIKRLARDCHVTVAHALGLMCSLWTWTLRMSPDGDLSSFENEDIEDAAGWDGDSGLFLKSASKNKLLDEIESGSFQLHDWADYASRLKARVRKRAERERKKRDSHSDSHNSELQNVTVTPTDRPTDRTDHIPDSSESVSDQIRELESRYGNEIEIIHDAREACALSRKNGKMADSVWLKVLRELAPHDIGVVLEAITRFTERHADGEKNERYLLGIVRGQRRDKKSLGGLFDSGPEEEPYFNNELFGRPDGAER